MMSQPELRLGYGSAVAVIAEVVAFAMSLAWFLIAPSAAAKIASYAVCLLLAPSYVMMIACVPGVTREDRRAFAKTAFGLGVMYAVLVASVYYLQLTVIRLGTYDVSAEALRLIVFTPGSPGFALDMLGYTFLCLSTLALVPALNGHGPERALRLFCGIHGILALPTAAFPALRVAQQGSSSSDTFGSIVLLAWCVIFLPIPILISRLFGSRLFGGRMKGNRAEQPSA